MENSEKNIEELDRNKQIADKAKQLVNELNETLSEARSYGLLTNLNTGIRGDSVSVSIYKKIIY